jgi:AcrR family transcriptional regulator
MPSPTDDHAVVDGRRARRERGRLAVTNAMIDLVFEGHAPPTADAVADRAGVSVASLFRYFETLDDLREQATALYFERYADLFEVSAVGVGSLDERIATFVTARVAQHESTSPMARLMRWRAFEISELDATLRRLRATQSDQVRLHFRDELTLLTRAASDDLVATIASITSFESWDQFRHDHGRTPAQIHRAWATTLHRILAR